MTRQHQSLSIRLKQIEDDYLRSLRIPLSIIDEKGDEVVPTILPDKFHAEIMPESASLATAWQRAVMHALQSIGSGMEFVIHEVCENVALLVLPLRSGEKPLYIVVGPVRFKNPNILLCERQALAFDIAFEDYFEAILTLDLLQKEKLLMASTLFKGTALAFLDLILQSKEAGATNGDHIDFKAAV